MVYAVARNIFPKILPITGEVMAISRMAITGPVTMGGLCGTSSRTVNYFSFSGTLADVSSHSSFSSLAERVMV